jgi:hypothetical protein
VQTQTRNFKKKKIIYISPNSVVFFAESGHPVMAGTSAIAALKLIQGMPGRAKGHHQKST